MKDKLTAYKIWAPAGAVWSQWAKPVLFVEPLYRETVALQIPKPKWTDMADYKTAIIVDLPGKAGVEEGLTLARYGYRPVPLYNGVNGRAAIVDTEEVAAALFCGADELERIAIRPDAPPAFLLDANRLSGKGKQPGKYDNRWCVFPQDMPSAAFLLEHGIEKIFVRARSNSISNDLSHIYTDIRKKGFKFWCAAKRNRKKFPWQSLRNSKICGTAFVSLWVSRATRRAGLAAGSPTRRKAAGIME